MNAVRILTRKYKIQTKNKAKLKNTMKNTVEGKQSR